MPKPLLTACSLALLTALSSCTNPLLSNGESYSYAPERPKTADELRAELLQQEQSAPGEYLKANASYRRNLIGQLVIEGDIANQATLANFKDPRLSVTWYTKTNTELETMEYPIYEVVRAQGSTHFKLKTNAPRSVATVAVDIAGATAVE